MKILVTGATGFIGMEIVDELKSNNYEVIGVQSPKHKSGKLSFDSVVNTLTIDITNVESIVEIEKIGEVDVVVHSAGLAHQFGVTKREEFESVNVEGTRNIANLAVKLKAKHFILISSTAVYGIVTNIQNGVETIIIDEDTELKPQTLYAKSKLEAETVCRQICEANNLALTIFRLAPVVGEANVGNVSRLISQIDKRRFLWIGKGANIKTLIYKRDVARACVALIKHKSGATEIFILAAEPIEMKTFVGEISRRLNRKVPPVSIPPNFIKFIFQINSKFIKSQKVGRLGDTIEKWLSDDVYSGERIARRYGFKPETSIAEALRKQVDWYRNEKNKQ